MKAWILKAALPVLLVAGGVGAVAFSGSDNPASAGPRAWIDVPVAGAVFATGPVTVQAHGSGPGGVDQIELFVDGASVEVAAAKGDDRLSRATFTWKGSEGTHALAVRSKAGGAWGPQSDAVPVSIGSFMSTQPTTTTPGSDAPTTVPGVTTTSTTSTTTTTIPGVTTTVDEATGSTTIPSTTRPRPTAPPTTLPALAPPAVSTSNNWTYQSDPLRLSAISDYTGTQTLRIEVRHGTSGAFTTVTTCSGSPCRTEYSFAGIGFYDVRAVLSTPDGRKATSTTVTVRVSPSQS